MKVFLVPSGDYILETDIQIPSVHLAAETSNLVPKNLFIT